MKYQENAHQNYQQPYAGQHYDHPPKKRYRSTSNKWIAGVCGGLAEHFNLNPTMVRVLWVLLTIFSLGFGGVIAYLVLWLMVDKYPAFYMAQGPYVTQDEQGKTHYHYYYRTTR